MNSRMLEIWLSGVAFLIVLGVFVVRFFYTRRKEPNPIALTPAEARFERSKRILDPTKRKSLQPGHNTVPKGYRVASPGEVVHHTQMPVAVERKIIPTTPSPITNDTATLEQLKKLEGVSFHHKFYGSQLIVGETIIVRGLSKALHNMEITERGQLFIDNLPYTINPTDLARVKQELDTTRQ